MKRLKSYISLSLAVCLAIIMQGFAVGMATSNQTPPKSPFVNSLYLPVVERKSAIPTNLGVEMITITPSNGLGLMSKAGVAWVRRNAVLWSEVESTKGTLDWSTQAGLEDELRTAASVGMQVILIVRGTPAWAQQVTGYSCGPIKQSELATFASFIYALVARYSAPPYNVHYFEMWNEPDLAPELASAPDSNFGCWGNSNEATYGGGYYGEMLKMIYPQIKAANSGAKLLIGGLLLDCDPVNAPAKCRDARSPHFLEGILQDGAGGSFDGVSFHAYEYYANKLGAHANPNWPGSELTIIAKARYLRSVLATNGITGKFLINTEVAMISGTDLQGNSLPCDASCEQTKAYYVAKVYPAVEAEGLLTAIWYTATNSWRNSGLLEANNQPKPAYWAYAFTGWELRQSTFLAEDASNPAIKLYKFARPDRQVWVAWATGSNTVLSLSSMPLAVYNWNSTVNNYGVVTPSQAPSIGSAPVFLEFNP